MNHKTACEQNSSQAVFSFGKHVLPDGQHHRSGKDPLAGAFGRVIKVDSAAGGIPAVESILRCAAGAVGDGNLIKLSVGDRTESARLKENFGHGVGEGRVANPIEDHGAYGHLTGVRFAASLGGNHTAQQGEVVVTAGIGGRTGAGGGNAQRGQRFLSANTVCRKTALLLKIFYRLSGLLAVYAVHLSIIISPTFEFGLNGADGIAPAALSICGGAGGEQKNDQAKAKKSRKKKRTNTGMAFHSTAPHAAFCLVCHLRIKLYSDGMKWNNAGDTVYKAGGGNMKWMRWELAMGLALAMAILVAIPVQAQRELAEKITRLHVLANSDLPADQQLKLKVRDAVLEVAAQHIELNGNALAEMEIAAQEIIETEGYCYPVSVSRGRYYFDTRVYETFSLPAGEYDSVRVIIGEGQGRNWWCVLYPQLCAGLCEEDMRAIAADAGLSQNEISLICEEKGYIIQFRLADFWGRVLQQINAL